jgi:hypothetical protein
VETHILESLKEKESSPDSQLLHEEVMWLEMIYGWLKPITTKREI